jgi:hypothetical protein
MSKCPLLFQQQDLYSEGCSKEFQKLECSGNEIYEPGNFKIEFFTEKI